MVAKRRTAVQGPTDTPLPPAGVSLQEVDGGLGYYGKFTSGLPTDPGFFPIGVWYESVLSQGDIDKDKDAGLNLYVQLTETSSLPLIRSNGMHAIFWQPDFSTYGPEAVGWFLADELDMEDAGHPDVWLAELLSRKAALPADGRAGYANFGKGVMFWNSDAEAARYLDAVDLFSDDIYWFTDDDSCTQWQGGALFLGGARPLTSAECRRASNYGAAVERMRRLVDRSKPVWNFVEVGHPFTDDSAPTISAPQIRAAVWHSIIAGARGILYFNHNFGGPCISQHVLRDSCGAAVRPTVKSTNEQIRLLAPVLNAPFVTSGWTASPSVKAMVKWQGGHFWVFAGSSEGTSSTGTLDLPCVGDATATVLGENRSVAVNGGSFSDGFADGNAIHIYRVDGGSTCGLPMGAAEPAPGQAPAGPGDQPVVGGSPGRKPARVGLLPRRVSLRSGRLVVPVSCGAACDVRSRLTTFGAARRVRLAAVRRRFGVGRHRLVVRLSRRARRYVARARRPLHMRLHTVIVEPGGAGARRTQDLVARR